MGSESLGFEKDSLKSRQGRRDDYYPFDVENSDFSTGVSLQRSNDLSSIPMLIRSPARGRNM